MAMSKRLKQLHAKQVAAAETQFEAYKNFIVQEFIDKFGGSYQTSSGMMDIWRNAFVFRPECEDFLMEKTKMFLFLLDNNHDHKSPHFLKSLIGKISEYLSVYICKKGVKRNTCTQQIKQILFDKNRYIQMMLRHYQSESNKASTTRMIQLKIKCTRESVR